MKKISYILFLLISIFVFYSCNDKEHMKFTKDKFIRVEGQYLIKSNSDTLHIKGTNLGNWLNPEGYMFMFKDVNSYRTINDVLCELVGPEFTGKFWSQFLENYITQADIKYIKSIGMNSIRLPFHYKLFTEDNYMGKRDGAIGYEIFDKVLDWCRGEGLYVILDMHDAPGGQTGDNIDDSYGYPWLFEEEGSQQEFCDIWQAIASKYANDTIVLGYDLMNEPIAHYFEKDYPHLNTRLEPLYKRCVNAIRQVDKNHIILLGGAQWNSNFKVFTDSKFDNNIMYTCHRYKSDTLVSNVRDLIQFRDSVNLPMYMGETGENTNEWVGGFRRMLEANNIGWHFWPYKKMPERACIAQIPMPENWDLIVQYTKEDRGSFAKIRGLKVDRDLVRKSLTDLLENMKFENCKKNEGYIDALGMSEKEEVKKVL